jgi:hypothetical protein
MYLSPHIAPAFFSPPHLSLSLSLKRLSVFLSLTQRPTTNTKREETWKLHAPPAPYQKTKEESTPPNSLSLSFFNGPAGPKFMWKEKQKRKKERMGKKRKRR